MLFTRISFTALLLFVATVSSAPLPHGPAAGVRTHAGHTSDSEGLAPARPRGSKKHLFTSLAAAQGAPGTIVLVHAAPHVQVHNAPDQFLEGPDTPMQQYARSPMHDPDVHFAHHVAETAHRAAAAAHYNAARIHREESNRQRTLGNHAAMEAARERGDAHVAMAGEHEVYAAGHASRMAQLKDRSPMRDSASAHEIETANKSAMDAVESARTARSSA